MAPITFHLITLKSTATESNLIDSLKTLQPSERPTWVGKCRHWIHEPHLSADSLLGSGAKLIKWSYLLVSNSTSPLPSALTSLSSNTWSISSNPSDDLLASLPPPSNDPIPPLPAGWSQSDPSGLDAAVAPDDLEASLDLSSYPLGCQDTSTTQKIGLKSYIRTFPDTTPVFMFNLLSYFPNQRENYFKYVAAFQQSVGSTYGGVPKFVGFNVEYWSSEKNEEREEAWKWEDTALISYPSLWHFGKMLDSEGYADADRKYKKGVIRDNPLICCTEVEVEWAE